MRDLSRAVRVAAVVAVLAVLAGCGTTSGTPVGTTVTARPDVGGLVGALGRVRATAQSTLLVEYGDVEAVRGLVSSDKQRFRNLEGYGYSDLAPRSALLGDAVGFDPRTATGAIRVGKPPSWAGVLWLPVDLPLVNSKFDRIGAKRADENGATTWITAGDDVADLKGPFGEMGIITGFNKVRVSADSVAYGPSSATLAWVVEPGTSTLAGDKAVRDLASCLGDAVAALLTTGPTPVAAGVRVVGDQVDEVVCVPAGKPAELRDRVQARLDDVAPGRGPVWATVLRDARAEIPDDHPGMVRVVVPAGPGTTAGRVFQAFQRNDLPALFG
ncbi:hypothetical protein AB0I60_03765 [Actinosynnema sp. NPDC050436]|uniref:hypothetical protein n=1 Tax=Actinosynnema sp. NPDC050436 TaxID=3155659 RepID=UPI0033C12BBC